MSDRVSLIIAIAATAACVLWITPDTADLMLNPDAGSQLSKGFAILHGRHPFVEIDSSVYGPAIFYLSALGQWVAPGSLGGEFSLILGGYALAYGLMYWTLLRHTPPGALYWTFVVICILTLPVFHKYHVVLSPAIYIFCLQVASTRPSATSMGVWLGAGSALAGLFRLDFGAYCVLASLTFLWFESRHRSGPLSGKALVAMLGTGALIGGLWAIYPILVVGPVESLHRFTDTTLGVYGGLAKGLPPFDVSHPFAIGNRLILTYWSMKFLSLAVVCVALTASFQRRRSDVASSANLAVLAAAGVAAAGFYLQAGHRIDFSHVQQVFAPIALVAIIAAAAGWARGAVVSPVALLVPLVSATILVGVEARVLRPQGFSYVAEALGSWRLTRQQIVDRAADGHQAQSHLALAMNRVHTLTEPDDAVLFLPYAAQTYYFSHRMFETPFGWLNPGRFRAPLAEQQFIASMDNTVLIVDQPSFSFDQLEERNMRSYAPDLSRHIYSHYGIFEVIGPYVLVSSDPGVLDHDGQYSLALIERPGPPPSPPDRLHQELVATVNTLPVRSDPYADGPARIHRHGGLLLGLATGTGPPVTDSCAVLASRYGDVRYVIADPAGHPVRVSAIGNRDLVDTRAVVPGRYHLLAVAGSICDAVAVENGARSAQITAQGAELWFDRGERLELHH